MKTFGILSILSVGRSKAMHPSFKDSEKKWNGVAVAAVQWREVIVVEACRFGEARHQYGGVTVMRFTVTVFITRLFWSR